ncbi:MAG: hypothetical protein HC798_04000 [Polaribacter sp.]|nr:hypothetical protein [Polaribacter sp.]
MRIVCFFICFLSISINAQYQFKLPEHFRTKRELPLIDFPTSVNAILTDFGAIPNDGKDDTEAILKALEYARKLTLFGSNVKIIFPKGKIDLFTNNNKNHLIEIKNLKNVIIEGNDAEITIHDPLKGFLSIFKSNNIIVKNLYIDYDPLPFTQGKIMAIDLKDKTFQLKIDEGFPELSHTMFQESNQVWGMLMDPKIPGKLKDGAPNLFGSKNFEEIEKGFLKLKSML